MAFFDKRTKRLRQKKLLRQPSWTILDKKYLTVFGIVFEYLKMKYLTKYQILILSNTFGQILFNTKGIVFYLNIYLVFEYLTQLWHNLI